jgi:hypothetical protein
MSFFKALFGRGSRGNTKDGFSDAEVREIRGEIEPLVRRTRANRPKPDEEIDYEKVEREAKVMSDGVEERLRTKYGITGSEFDEMYRQISRQTPDNS